MRLLGPQPAAPSPVEAQLRDHLERFAPESVDSAGAVLRHFEGRDHVLQELLDNDTHGKGIGAAVSTMLSGAGASADAGAASAAAAPAGVSGDEGSGSDGEGCAAPEPVPPLELQLHGHLQRFAPEFISSADAVLRQFEGRGEVLQGLLDNDKEGKGIAAAVKAIGNDAGAGDEGSGSVGEGDATSEPMSPLELQLHGHLQCFVPDFVSSADAVLRQFEGRGEVLQRLLDNDKEGKGIAAAVTAIKHTVASATVDAFVVAQKPASASRELEAPLRTHLEQHAPEHVARAPMVLRHFAGRDLELEVLLEKDSDGMGIRSVVKALGSWKLLRLRMGKAVAASTAVADNATAGDAPTSDASGAAAVQTPIPRGAYEWPGSRRRSTRKLETEKDVEEALTAVRARDYTWPGSARASLRRLEADVPAPAPAPAPDAATAAPKAGGVADQASGGTDSASGEQHGEQAAQIDRVQRELAQSAPVPAAPPVSDEAVRMAVADEAETTEQREMPPEAELQMHRTQLAELQARRKDLAAEGAALGRIIAAKAEEERAAHTEKASAAKEEDFETAHAHKERAEALGADVAHARNAAEQVLQRFAALKVAERGLSSKVHALDVDLRALRKAAAAKATRDTEAARSVAAAKVHADAYEKACTEFRERAERRAKLEEQRAALDKKLSTIEATVADLHVRKNVASEAEGEIALLVARPPAFCMRVACVRACVCYACLYRC